MSAKVTRDATVAPAAKKKMTAPESRKKPFRSHGNGSIDREERRKNGIEAVGPGWRRRGRALPKAFDPGNQKQNCVTEGSKAYITTI